MIVPRCLVLLLSYSQSVTRLLQLLRLLFFGLVVTRRTAGSSTRTADKPFLPLRSWVYQYNAAAILSYYLYSELLSQGPPGGDILPLGLHMCQDMCTRLELGLSGGGCRAKIALTKAKASESRPGKGWNSQLVTAVPTLATSFPPSANPTMSEPSSHKPNVAREGEEGGGRKRVLPLASAFARGNNS